MVQRTHKKQWQIQDFSLEGAPTRWWGANLRRRCFLAKSYAEMKELGPVGGTGWGRGRPWIRQ